MKYKYLLVVFIVIILFGGLAPEKYNDKIVELNNELIKRGIPENWLLENIKNDKFVIYDNIENMFIRMPENRVKNNEKDFEWYKNQFGFDEKVTLGKKFIQENTELLKKVEARHGIHYELIVAIYGMETNYGDKRFIGKYYVFPALVSQYILTDNRKRFAIKELENLYYFSEKIKKPVFYFIGSYSGASGFAQFIPTSLNNYFVDSNNNNEDIDIYSVDDTLFSIENYLFNSRLNRQNISSEDSRMKAVLSYNHSFSYAKIVLLIYDELKKN
jgi:membrane-bound lytic murein transglycosylase B